MRLATAAVPSDGGERPVRSPGQSWVSDTIPLASDETLRQKYINIHNDVRIGRLLEKLDVVAASSAYLHVDPDRDVTAPDAHQALPYYIVTAAVDSMDVINPISAQKDVVLQGCVINVGRSSMEVRMEVAHAEDDGSLTPLILSKFIMVARCKTKHTSHEVPDLKATTDRERLLAEEGRLSNLARRAQRQRSLRVEPPTADEQRVLHTMFAEMKRRSQLRSVDKDCVLTADTRLQTTLMAHPQSRNIHNKIFGGYLMRMAFELGYATAHIHAKVRPLLVTVDEISFLHAVNIGSMIQFTADVIFTGKTTVQVAVDADVVDPSTGDRVTTNTFHFVYSCLGNTARPVRPNSYSEAMQWLTGLRRYNDARERTRLGLRRHFEVTPPGTFEENKTSTIHFSYL